MIEPGQYIIDSVHRGHGRQSRPAQQDHRDAKRARRGDLAVGGLAAAVLGNDNVDAMVQEQSALIGFRERAARQQVFGPWQPQGRHDRIDGSDQVIVLRGDGERGHFLAADAEKDATRTFAERAHGFRAIGDLLPMIAGDGAPGRALQRQQLSPGARGGLCRVRRHSRRVRMGGVDQDIDARLDEVGGQALDAAEAAAAHRHRLRGGCDRAAGERQRDAQIVTRGQVPGQLPRFEGAAKDEDMSHVAI